MNNNNNKDFFNEVNILMRRKNIFSYFNVFQI